MGAGPIRVESKEVLVPVVVIDKKGQAQLQREAPSLAKQALDGKKLVIFDESVAAIAIPDLTAQEIHLFEDGVEQSIVNATFEPEPYWNVKDNLGYHSEFIGRGEGRWSGPQWPEGRIADCCAPLSCSLCSAFLSRWKLSPSQCKRGSPECHRQRSERLLQYKASAVRSLAGLGPQVN
jgi:hypothetical protein